MVRICPNPQESTTGIHKKTLTMRATRSDESKNSDENPSDRKKTTPRTTRKHRQADSSRTTTTRPRTFVLRRADPSLFDDVMSTNLPPVQSSDSHPLVSLDSTVLNSLHLYKSRALSLSPTALCYLFCYHSVTILPVNTRHASCVDSRTQLRKACEIVQQAPSSKLQALGQIITTVG